MAKERKFTVRTAQGEENAMRIAAMGGILMAAERMVTVANKAVPTVGASQTMKCCSEGCARNICAHGNAFSNNNGNFAAVYCKQCNKLFHPVCLQMQAIKLPDGTPKEAKVSVFRCSACMNKPSGKQELFWWDAKDVVPEAESDDENHLHEDADDFGDDDDNDGEAEESEEQFDIDDDDE